MRHLPHSNLVFPALALGFSLVMQTAALKAASLTPTPEPASPGRHDGSSTGGTIEENTGGDSGDDIGGERSGNPSAKDIKDTGPTGECDRLTAPKELLDPKKTVAAQPIDWDHALTICQAALEAHPNEPHFHLTLATALYHLKRYVDANKHYKIAADAGIPSAQSSLGFEYVRGYGVVKDDQKAFELWSKAAEAGWPAAMGNLGTAYADGVFVKKDPAKSLDWDEKAIEAGNVLSLSVVGNAYLNGNGVQRDFAMAAQYFQQGADLGEGYALKSLANMYEAGFMGAPQPQQAGALRLRAQQLDPDSPDPSSVSVFKSILASTRTHKVAHTAQRRRYVIFRRYRFIGCGWMWC